MNIVNDEIKNKFQEAEDLRFKNRFEDAIKIYKEIVKKIPDFNPALHNIGVCYTNLKKIDEAEKYYVKCLNLNGIHFQTLNNLAKIYLEKKNYVKAFPLLKNSLSKVPNQEKVAESMAECMFNLKFTKELDLFCSHALKTYPSNKIFPIFYGKNLLRLGNHKEGVKQLTKITGAIEFSDEKVKII